MPRAIGSVTCEMHGPMKLDFATDRWICVGFDGEGCPIQLNAEDLCKTLGTIDARHITVTPTGRLKWR